MTTEQKIIELLDGKYQYETIEYFQLNEEDRDKIANTIMNDFFYNIKQDENYRNFYLEFVDFRIQEFIRQEKYEAVDLYERLKNQIIFY